MDDALSGPAGVAALKPAQAASRATLGSRAFAWALVGALVTGLARPHLRMLSMLAYDAGLLLLFAFDNFQLTRARIRVARDIDERLRVRTRTRYSLTIEHEGPRALRVWVRDGLPSTLQTSVSQHSLRLAKHAHETLEAEITPSARGLTNLTDIHVRCESALGLAARVLRIGGEQTLRVMPEGTHARKGRQDGPRMDVGDVAMRIRRASSGTELESLREYVSEDPLRAIDWKATAKRRRPVTRVYRPERSQTLWMVLDASRTMATTIGAPDASVAMGPRTRFDVALDSALVLADGALRAGDHVGALVYGDELARVVPPGRGRAHYRRLVDSLSEESAHAVHLDVKGLVAQLVTRIRKRSLVVLFTDLENESHGEALYQHATMLTRRHLTLCVSLDDAVTKQLESKPIAQDRDVYLRAAAVDMLRERTELTRRLSTRGVLVLEADERGLAAKTLERYLSIKLQERV